MRNKCFGHNWQLVSKRDYEPYGEYRLYHCASCDDMKESLYDENGTLKSESKIERIAFR